MVGGARMRLNMNYVLKVERGYTGFADELDMEFESKRNSRMNVRF